MTNTNALRKKIAESGLKIKYIAEKMGITYQGLLNKIDNKTEFTASEIVSLCKILNLSNRERDAIFFAKKVDSESIT